MNGAKAVTVTLFLLIGSACSAVRSPVEKDTLRVLVWNVLHGANDVERGPEKALRVIEAAAPDLVLMQESYEIDGDRPTLGRWIAGRLGWQCHQSDSPHLCVLTKDKIRARFVHHPWHGVGVRIRDEVSREFLAYSIWIDYRAFLGYELRDNPQISDDELLRAESARSSRLPQTQSLIEHLSEQGHLAADVPLLVGGDWNTPSHLDWTPDAARVYRRRRPLALPVSRAMESAGFTDVFRGVHPNPIQRPGITWTPMFRAGNSSAGQAFDRIDRLYLKNADRPSGGWQLEPAAAKVLPEQWDPGDLPPNLHSFPSDHCAVLLTMRWRRGGRAP